MSAAEVAVEQLLAGVLTLLAFALVFVHPAALEGITSSAAAILVGAAYLLGVVFDRALDTILGGAEAWARLRQVDDIVGRSDRPDPFPQDRIEAQLRRPDASAWMSYLRTRVRIARSVAVLGPLIGLSFAIWLTKPAVVTWRAGQPASAAATPGTDTIAAPWIQLPNDQPGWQVALLPPAIFVFAFVAALGLARALPRGYRMPRTHEWTRGAGAGRALRWRSQAWAPLWSIYVPCLAAAFLAWLRGAPTAVTASGLAGVAIGAVGAWAWVRVLDTYLGFLASSDRLPPRERQ